MIDDENIKKYDLECRTFLFAKRTRLFINNIPKNISNFEDSKQLTRSTGSIGANYIKANESLGKKDKIMRMRISKKEAKESIYWLRLLDLKNSSNLEMEQKYLIDECNQLMKILGSIIEKLNK